MHEDVTRLAICCPQPRVLYTSRNGDNKRDSDSASIVTTQFFLSGLLIYKKNELQFQISYFSLRLIIKTTV